MDLICGARDGKEILNLGTKMVVRKIWIYSIILVATWWVRLPGLPILCATVWISTIHSTACRSKPRGDRIYLCGSQIRFFTRVFNPFSPSINIKRFVLFSIYANEINGLRARGYAFWDSGHDLTQMVVMLQYKAPWIRFMKGAWIFSNLETSIFLTVDWTFDVVWTSNQNRWHNATIPSSPGWVSWPFDIFGIIIVAIETVFRQDAWRVMQMILSSVTGLLSTHSMGLIGNWSGRIWISQDFGFIRL